MLEFSGKGTEGFFNEAGGHRIQRIPPNEKRGRVHSSTVTVAVMEVTESNVRTLFDSRADKDFDVQWYNGTVGAGGQNHQKTENCVRLTHKSSGIVKTAQTRSRLNSMKNAMEAMNAELDKQSTELNRSEQNAVRKMAVGSGERSDKRRTYRFQEGLVHDHESGKSSPVTKIMKGNFPLLW